MEQNSKRDIYHDGFVYKDYVHVGFGRADHWNTESEAEHNEAFEAFMQHLNSFVHYPVQGEHKWVDFENVTGRYELQYQIKGAADWLPVTPHLYSLHPHETKRIVALPTASVGDKESLESKIIEAVNKAVENFDKNSPDEHKKNDSSELKLEVKEREETLQYIRDVMVNNGFTQPDQMYHYWNDKRNRVKEMWRKFEESDPLNQVGDKQEAKEIGGTALYPLFKFFADAYNLILLDSEIELIIDTIVNFEQMRKQTLDASQDNKMGTHNNSLNFEIIAPVDFNSPEMKKAIAKIKVEIAEIMEGAKVDTSKLHITFNQKPC